MEVAENITYENDINSNLSVFVNPGARIVIIIYLLLLYLQIYTTSAGHISHQSSHYRLIFILFIWELKLEIVRRGG